MTQKQLKEKYMDVIKKEVWSDEDMQEYARKECAYVVELSNGNIIAIDKPRIKKDFCFGMGMYATYTQEEFEKAEELAEEARSNVNYFVSHNMEQLTNVVDDLKESLNGSLETYTFVQYCGQPEDTILKGFNIVRICNNPECNPLRWSRIKAVKKLDNEDIEKIIAGYESVIETFQKRLNTYLKKYGLSKLNVWTYCRD